MAGPGLCVALYLLYSPPLLMGWVLAAPLAFLTLAIFQPALEELVFRGLLQDWLMQKTWAAQSIIGITHANIVTSLAFTALHFIHHPPLMAAAVFVPSLIFGYFRDKYEGWLVPSIFLHCFYNAGYFLLYPPNL